MLASSSPRQPVGWEVTVAVTRANVAMRGLMDEQFGLVAVINGANSKFGSQYICSVKKGDLLPCLQS